MAEVSNLMNVTWVADFSGLDLIDASIDGLTSDAIRETLDDVKKNIIKNWSDESPSAPGEPPAKVSGDLEKSIRVYRRDARGVFATAKNAITWSLQVSAIYGAALEFGDPSKNLAPRPFIRPQMKRAKNELGDRIAEKFKFTGSSFVIKPFSAQRVYQDTEIEGMG